MQILRSFWQLYYSFHSTLNEFWTVRRKPAGGKFEIRFSFHYFFRSSSWDANYEQSSCLTYAMDSCFSPSYSLKFLNSCPSNQWPISTSRFHVATRSKGSFSSSSTIPHQTIQLCRLRLKSVYRSQTPCPLKQAASEVVGWQIWSSLSHLRSYPSGHYETAPFRVIEKLRSIRHSPWPGFRRQTVLPFQ